MNEDRSAEKRKLNILILSCSTGGGHNAAGRAMEEYFRQQGQIADFPDYLAFAGQKVSDTVGRIYVKTVQKAPRVFGMVLPAGRCSKPACETFPGILCKFHDGGISG